MSMCRNARCNGTDFLCGRCRREYPSLAASLDEQKRQRRSGGNRGRSNGGWQPRTQGYGADGSPVTFRKGRSGTSNEGHTLISDGHKSDREFRREHNHYGDNRESGGRVEDNGGNRGHYTGPGH